MLRRRPSALALACTASSMLCSSALAEGVLFPGARPLGTGGAMRALATGDAGPQLNPSGISLVRSYQLVADYQYGSTAGSNDARIAAIDSTSSLNLGGALDYTYHHASVGGQTESAHLVGASLSFPFADKIFLGGSAKYLHFSAADATTHSGFTFDAGLTVKPVAQVALGAVGYNLNDLGVPWLPRGVGGGVAILPVPALIMLFDMVYEKVYGDPTRDAAIDYMGGAEFSFSAAGAIRAGGGWNGATKNGYLSGGVSVLSADVGALDVGVRQDISGLSKSTMVGISARLFVPGM